MSTSGTTATTNAGSARDGRSEGSGDNKNSNTDMADLTIMQLADSFFPTGMYTMSNGLEALYYSGRKLKPDQFSGLVRIFIECQMGPADTAALGNAYRCAAGSDLDGLIIVDRVLHSMKLVQEIRNASARSGTQMLRCVNSFVASNKLINDYAAAIKAGRAYGPYPVALAAACNAMSVPARKAGLAMLYSFTVGMVGAALRLGMFQHFDGQKIIDELKPVIVRAVDDNLGRSVEEMWQFAPQIDLVQMSHERMVSKMFIT